MVETILSTSSHQAFSYNSQLYIEGDKCPGIAFLLSGEIRVYKIAESGREITLYEIFPGETCILNASCILSRQNYPANAMGLTDGTMLYLPETVFQTLIAKHQAMRTFIFSLFSRRYHEIIELIEEVTFGKLDVRLENYLIEKAENDELRTTHQHISNDLGTSREVISRLLKDFERQGKIVLSRNHIQLNQI
ncbi:MAG: Crp/Fnr family transcriptional regulator [Deltaproteobacteria bacterium]|nr:Crp/Fnr family transcriptional regulator [Deltaproteobacteria bacterium]